MVGIDREDEWLDVLCASDRPQVRILNTRQLFDSYKSKPVVEQAGSRACRKLRILSGETTGPSTRASACPSVSRLRLRLLASVGLVALNANPMVPQLQCSPFFFSRQSPSSGTNGVTM